MPSFTYQPMTELESVNLMLTTIGESPVSTLNVTGDLNVSVARQMLYDVSREVQTHGWYFNTESNYPLVRDVDSYITVPTNTLSVDLALELSYLDVVLRGTRLYDKENHTYVFDKDVEVDLVLFLEWDLMPQAARQYITIVAARRFQRRLLGDDFTDSVTAEEELRAKAQLDDADAWERDYNMKDSLDVYETLRR